MNTEDKQSRIQGYHISFQGHLVHLAFYVDNTVGEDRMVYGQIVCMIQSYS